jgi:hypothetical protein
MRRRESNAACTRSLRWLTRPARLPRLRAIRSVLAGIRTRIPGFAGLCDLHFTTRASTRGGTRTRTDQALELVPPTLGLPEQIDTEGIEPSTTATSKRYHLQVDWCRERVMGIEPTTSTLAR